MIERPDNFDDRFEDDNEGDRDIEIETNPFLPDEINQDEFQNPNFEYFDYSQIVCVKKPSTFIHLSNIGVANYDVSDEFISGTNFLRMTSDSKIILAPSFQRSKLKFDMTLKLENPRDEGNPERFQQSMTITLEDGDYFEASISQSGFNIILVKGSENNYFLDSDEIGILSNSYSNYAIEITLVQYDECTTMEEEKEEEYEEEESQEVISNPNDVYILLGGLIAVIVLSYIFSTTGEGNGD